ncbi:MAG: OB-fold domain-containing protein [Dehalococcoidia bacterium]|nr:OB-fold domain-containing protein [Dehalococcoidia bacterium]
MEGVALSRIGKLYSFTTVRIKPPHFIGQPPYLVGVVELPEGERIRTLLTECDKDSLKIGMEMELVIERIGTSTEVIGKIEVGTELLGWKFRPLRGKQQ